MARSCNSIRRLTIVYPLDYARTRLASDVGSGKKTFNGLGTMRWRANNSGASPSGLNKYA